jgi:hypothetical protein
MSDKERWLDYRNRISMGLGLVGEQTSWVFDKALQAIEQTDPQLQMKYDQALDVIVGLSNDIQELKEIIADRTNDIIHQQKEIEQLKEKLQVKEILDKNTKVIIRQYAKKVKHLFPLENMAGYGQLCELVLHFEKALEEIIATYQYGEPNHLGEVMVEVEDTCDAMYQIAVKVTKPELV